MAVEPRKMGVASERNPCGAAAVGCINFERQSSFIVASLRLVADGLDIVSVGVQNERAIVVLVIVRPRARTPIVFSAGGKRGSVELVHLLASFGTKGDMQPGIVGGSLIDPEIRLGRNPVPEDGRAAGVLFGDLHHHLVAERREGFVVKRAARSRVANLEASVVDHDYSSIKGTNNLRLPQ